MNDKKCVSVVIPNYNGMEFIEICLASLLTQVEPEQIIVVDNGSSDGSCEFMRSSYPRVRFIELEENYGFSQAVNEGIQAASSPYVILLNNDTKVCPGFVGALVEALEADEKAFSASARMLKMHSPDEIDDAGDFYCALGWAFARGKDKPAERYDQPDRIFAACGGAAIYRRQVMEEIGYFDEAHFAYLEDIDVGYRALIWGWHNLYEPKACVYHVGSGTSGSRYNEFKVSLTSRNSVYLVYKNMPFLQIVLNLPFLLAGFGVKYLFFLRKGLGKTYRKGLLAGCKLCRREKKVKFEWKNLSNYVGIQLALWRNLGKRLG